MKYSIGEVSKMYNISIDTLRYYDKIQLLKPNINLDNGYRYYDMEHIEQLMFILSAKELEIPLSEIKEVLDSEDLRQYKKLLSRQKDIIKEKIKHLQKLERVILNRSVGLDEIIKFENNYNFNELRILNNEKNFYYISSKDMEQDKELVEVMSVIYDESIGVVDEPELEDIFYTTYKIDDEKVIEDESYIYIIENRINKTILENYFLTKKGEIQKVKLEEKYISVKFYGNKEEIEDYILLLQKHFNINKSNKAYVGFHFNLSKKVNTEYFCEILYKI